MNAIEKLSKKFPESPLARPWFAWWAMTAKGVWNWKLLEDEVEHAIESSSNSWISFDLHELKWYCLRGTKPSEIDELDTVQRMLKLVERNKELEPFRSHVVGIVGRTYYLNENHKGALDNYELALQLSLKHDDICHAARMEKNLGQLVGRREPAKGLGLIESAEETFEWLGIKERASEVWTLKGLILDGRGDYDAAVRSYQIGLEARERLYPYLSTRYIPSGLSRSYRRMGQYEEALEWARMSLMSEPMLSYAPGPGLEVMSNLCMAAALSLLGRVEEASSYLDVSRKLVLKSGGWISDLYLCTGLLERARGELENAMLSFEKSFEIIEATTRQNRTNECLLRLAETELLLWSSKSHESSPESEFPWNKRFEAMAREMDLPGVLGLALILRAEIEIRQNKKDEAKTTLSIVGKIAANPNTRFLQKKIAELASAVSIRLKEK
jgi:tetratricopeptide (TPR) repeat protein